MPPGGTRDREPRRWVGLPGRIAVGFAIALASLAAVAGFAALGLEGLHRSSELVAHASAHRLAVAQLESALVVSDAALDAYLGSGEDRHLRRHERASARITPAAAELERLASPAEAEELERISSLVRIVEAEQAAVRALVAAGRPAEARSLRAEGAGAHALEHAKAEVDLLAGVQGREVAAGRASWATGVALSKLAFAVALAALVVLLLLGARVVRDEIRTRERNQEERERALAIQRRLMAVVSHDLRNPLGSLVSGGYVLSRMQLPPDASAIVRRMLGAGRRMERLIRDLLDWSRVHGGADIPVHVCDADLYDVCRRIADELGDRHGGRIHVERRGDTRGAFDPDRMEQVVANLLGNALQYAPPDSPVRVSAEGGGGALRLVVRDEGPGLPPEAREDLFKPFRRGTGHGDHGGLGLGLFIVRTLAEAQGGSVDVESAPGAGTTFTVTVPAAAPADDGDRPPTTH